MLYQTMHSSATSSVKEYRVLLLHSCKTIEKNEVKSMGEYVKIGTSIFVPQIAFDLTSSEEKDCILKNFSLTGSFGMYYIFEPIPNSQIDAKEILHQKRS